MAIRWVGTAPAKPVNAANADEDNFAPAGWDATDILYVTPLGVLSALTGLGDGTQMDGRLMTIISQGDTLTIKHQDTKSSAGNRFHLPGLAVVVLTNGSSATFRYNATTSRWNCVSSAR